jgi:hypothetical protein
VYCHWYHRGLRSVAPCSDSGRLNQKTQVSFDHPIEIPGRVLSAGTYWFVLYDSPSDRNIVMVYSADWSKKYAILFTNTAYRQQSTNLPKFIFAERPHDKPEALLTWFYPGHLTGHVFQYSSKHETEFASDPKQTL